MEFNGLPLEPVATAVRLPPPLPVSTAGRRWFHGRQSEHNIKVGCNFADARIFNRAKIYQYGFTLLGVSDGVKNSVPLVLRVAFDVALGGELVLSL